MTERASPSPESRHAAISRFFGRAMLSLRLLFSVSILALSGAPRQLSQRESLRQRAGFAGCKSLSLWERWHRAAMTERASPSPESRHAAISRFFGRAMLSLRLLFSVSILALSGAPRQLSQRESLRQRAGFAGCKSLSLWERWHRASDDGEGKLVSREPPRSDKLFLWESQNLTVFLHSRRKQGDSRRFY